MHQDFICERWGSRPVDLIPDDTPNSDPGVEKTWIQKIFQYNTVIVNVPGRVESMNPTAVDYHASAVCCEGAVRAFPLLLRKRSGIIDFLSLLLNFTSVLSVSPFCILISPIVLSFSPRQLDWIVLCCVVIGSL